MNSGAGRLGVAEATKTSRDRQQLGQLLQKHGVGRTAWHNVAGRARPDSDAREGEKDGDSGKRTRQVQSNAEPRRGT